MFCRVFPLKLLFIGIVTFVNLGKTIPDFPNTKGRSMYTSSSKVPLRIDYSTVHEALMDPRWKKAMNDEMEAL